MMYSKRNVIYCRLKKKSRLTRETEPTFESSTQQADRHYEQCSHWSRFIYSTILCFCKCISCYIEFLFVLIMGLKIVLTPKIGHTEKKGLKHKTENLITSP